jgi:mono/diheme cytochrome c family protein
MKRSRYVLAAAALLAAPSCDKKPTPPPAPSASAAPTAATTASATPDEPPGDAERGKKLVADFQCNRCHDGTGHPAPKMDQQCFGCHVKILDGTFKGPKGSEARWHDRVVGLDQVPSLTASQQRFRRSFLVRFLTSPFDLRPHLGPTMPRLAISKEQARDIATYLAGNGDAGKLDLAGADAARGKKLFELKACGSCHAFTGVMPKTEVKPDPKTGLAAGVMLAPDLRYTRERIRPEALVTWVTSPKKVKPDTLMPDFALSPAEARDLAAFVLGAELGKVAEEPAPPRLPVLERKVTYDEVSEKVFRRTCWHCHGEPDYAAGDGGPGNTGGLGFKGRGINFLSYESVQSGRLDDKGERHSLFEKASDGTPRLVRSLLARREEERGHADPEIRGMPLGYPSLTPEEIQLVESWVAQGRPR